MVTGPGSRVMSKESAKVIGQRSRVTGKGSLARGQGSLVRVTCQSQGSLDTYP